MNNQDTQTNSVVIRVVGCSYRDQNDVNMVKEFFHSPTTSLVDVFEFEKEPSNPYDENAVKVSFREKHVGYIAREDQEKFWNFIDSFDPSYCLVVEMSSYEMKDVEEESIRSFELTLFREEYQEEEDDTETE